MAAGDQPNVLMIVTDDQRFDTISALGNEAIETPHLDSLVASGCAMTRHHNMGSQGDAVCAPARAMIHGATSLFNLDCPRDVPTDHAALPERFGDAGYRTFGTGKWHNGTAAFNRCFEEGENVFFSGMGNHWNLPVCSRYPTGEYPDGEYDRYADGTHSSELFADAACEFLWSHDRRDADRPFFAYVAPTAPHDPRSAPGAYHDRYAGQVELPENFRQEHPFDNGQLHTRDEDLAAHPRDPEEVRGHIADYYAMITHLDAQIGRILHTLEVIGERENTIVVFTADHGLAVGQHGLLGKQNCYDHSLRVPLLFTGPGVPSDVRRSPLSVHYDIYPTLCDLAGIDAPGAVEGQSLVPAFSEEGHDHRQALFLSYSTLDRDLQRAVREDRFKLIEYFVDGDRRTQLFDMETDPLEQHNLAAESAHRDDLERLRARLRESQERLNDPMVADA